VKKTTVISFLLECDGYFLKWIILTSANKCDFRRTQPSKWHTVVTLC